MKRNRAEPAPPQTPAKTARRYAAPNAHQKLPQKPQVRAAAEEKPPAPAPAPSPAAEVVEQEIEWAPQLAGWDPAGEVAGAWSSWGVAEETLLGWFPFADEHFHGAAAAAAGAAPFLEEESFCCSYCYYYHDDIWHLQHIHDVPKH
ncbi:uncharacterized protein LOC109716531 [Ananas comosus]|uniref:Uncharacterized protein LOC109716531 n=1 Tax=Ananas comosus TaxID=4615 RepID=A0A6P5FVU6_ANACO|nr:uncharacterized protein LOC109716531 [Ananas comosus]